jgi:hypothetical protein
LREKRKEMSKRARDESDPVEGESPEKKAKVDNEDIVDELSETKEHKEKVRTLEDYIDGFQRASEGIGRLEKIKNRILIEIRKRTAICVEHLKRGEIIRIKSGATCDKCKLT